MYIPEFWCGALLILIVEIIAVFVYGFCKSRGEK